MGRTALFGLLPAAFVAVPAVAKDTEDMHHRLVLHIDQNAPALMTMGLNNAGHVVDYYQERGEAVAIEIVTYSQGVHMLRDDTSPVKDKIRELRGRLKGLSLVACNNTMRRMHETRSNGRAIRRGAPDGIAGAGLELRAAVARRSRRMNLFERAESTLERDDFSSNRHPTLAYCLSMIFSENRYPLFGIMLSRRCLLLPSRPLAGRVAPRSGAGWGDYSRSEFAEAPPTPNPSPPFATRMGGGE